MNNVIYNENEFQDFKKENQGTGILNIRAYAANSAIPMSGVNIIVSKVINNQNVIFFQGQTNDSGIISNIVLPTPLIIENNMVIPMSLDYDLKAVYENMELYYKIKMYSNITVLQNINIVPDLKVSGEFYGS